MPVDQMLLRERLAGLDLPIRQYAVYGDAALAAHGLITADRIDLIVAPRVFEELRERGWTVLPGTNGQVLVADDVAASRRARWTSHLSAIDMVGDVDQVAGLPVVKLPILRKHVAAQGLSGAVIWRLNMIDHALGVRTPAAGLGATAPPPAWVQTKRPGTLTAAGVITNVMSSIALLVFGPLTLIVLGDRGAVEDSDSMAQLAHDVGVDVSDLVLVIGISCLAAALLSVAALVLGILLLRNKRVRIALVVLSSVALLLSAFAVLSGALIALVWVIAAILVIVFCFIRDAGAWFDAHTYAAKQARQQRHNPPATHHAS